MEDFGLYHKDVISKTQVMGKYSGQITSVLHQTNFKKKVAVGCIEENLYIKLNRLKKNKERLKTRKQKKARQKRGQDYRRAHLGGKTTRHCKEMITTKVRMVVPFWERRGFLDGWKSLISCPGW